MSTPHYFRDPDFQRKLVALVCRDSTVLKECGHLLSPDDFKPRRDESPDLWTIGTVALEFWQKYRQPIAGMLRTEVLDYARRMNFTDRERTRLLETVKVLRKAGVLVAADALVEKVIAYKKDRLMAASVDKLIELREAGQLTDERWLQTCMEAVETFGGAGYAATDYFKGLEDRIARRIVGRQRKFPYLFIDPLDERVRTISRGHVALWMAYTGAGKSLALIHTALAYCIQGMNVLYFTLEDPLPDTEDRFDSAISVLPTKRLIELPKTLRARFRRFTRIIRSRLKIIDGTEGGMSVPRMEEIWDRERNRGFRADAVLIDYDDEIRPVKKQSERRFEFADIYRDLRLFAARRDILMWTAAQTGRQSEGKKILTSGMVAEDISKIRKVALAIGIGQGDWGTDSRYLYIAKHKFDKQHVGCPIMSAPHRSVFYDRQATLEHLAEDSDGEDAGSEV